MADEHPETTGERRPQRSIAPSKSLVAGLVLGGLITAFALVNLDKVKVDWILGTGSTPLIVVIAFAFLLGLGFDRALGPIRRARARRAERRGH